MTNELTVRVQSPVIPAMSWNEEEVQRNLDEMLAAYTGRVYTLESIKGAKKIVPRSMLGTSSLAHL